MSDYGVPYIPYSRLRELKNHVEMVCIALNQGDFTPSDLWRVYVGLEVNSLLANHWYGELDKARNYTGIDVDDCPLCVYDDDSGKFVAPCFFHKEIGKLQQENAELKQVISEIILKINAYYMGQAIGVLQNYVEENKEQIIRSITESKGDSEGS